MKQFDLIGGEALQDGCIEYTRYLLCHPERELSPLSGALHLLVGELLFVPSRYDQIVIREFPMHHELIEALKPKFSFLLRFLHVFLRIRVYDAP